MKKVYVVTDLGPGDGGKGGVVHKISHLRKAHTILKVGGAQGSHGVVTSSGDRFAFSQFGCGTFEGARTHLTSQFVAAPEGMLNEATALRYECGIHDPFDFLTVDERVVCATPFHRIASRLKELSRGSDPRGTIGTGVGEAFRDSQRYPELIIRARDLSGSNLRDKLAANRDQVHGDLAPLLGGDFLPQDRVLAEREIALLEDPGFLDYVVRRFEEAARCIRVVDHEYLAREICARDGVMVVESSHGVLTDHCMGFHPHTSALRTLPRFRRQLLEEAGYDGDIVNIGVTRAYSIRHGAGPMPTADEAMAERLLPGSHKEAQRYQGKVRVGPLDLVLLRYAIAAAGGQTAFDGLAITWFDQIQKNGSWFVCDAYRNATDTTYFTPSGDVKVRFGDDEAQLAYQEALGHKLRDCQPELTEHMVATDASREDLSDLCADVIQDGVGVPVRMVSLGCTERDKVLR